MHWKLTVDPFALFSVRNSMASQQDKTGKHQNLKKVNQRINDSVRVHINSILKIENLYRRANTSLECSYMVFQCVNKPSWPKVKAETSGKELQVLHQSCCTKFKCGPTRDLKKLITRKANPNNTQIVNYECLLYYIRFFNARNS